MRALLLLPCALGLTGCFHFQDILSGSVLTPPDARHLVLWPADPFGDRWRRADWVGGVPEATRSAPEAWPLAPLEVESPVAEATVFLPPGATPVLRTRAELLVLRARDRWVESAVHVRPLPFDPTGTDSARELYAQLLDARPEHEEGHGALLEVFLVGSPVGQPPLVAVPAGQEGAWRLLESDGFGYDLDEEPLDTAQLASRVSTAKLGPALLVLTADVTSGEHAAALAAEILERVAGPVLVARGRAAPEVLEDLDRLTLELIPFGPRGLLEGDVHLTARWHGPGVLGLFLHPGEDEVPD